MLRDDGLWKVDLLKPFHFFNKLRVFRVKWLAIFQSIC